MNLLEAFESGRRFRRRNHADDRPWNDPSADVNCFNSRDILAEDWEIEPRKKVKKTVWVGIGGPVGCDELDTSFAALSKDSIEDYEYGVHPIEIEVEE